MICLYLKIQVKFVCRILQDRFWIVYIPIVRIVKFKPLSQIQVIGLLHQVVSSITHFLRKFSALPYNDINHVVSITT